MNDEPPDLAEPHDFAESHDRNRGRGFWLVVLAASVLGVVGSVGSLVFLTVTGLGPDWYGKSETGWFDGKLWWVAVAGAAGLIIGILRHVFKMPPETPGIIENIKSGEVDAATVPKIVAVSAVSLIGGASLGPEVALGSIGGGTGGWIAKRQNLDSSDSQAMTRTGSWERSRVCSPAP